jgi:hypothetical protein
MPVKANAIPAIWSRRGRSPSTAAAKSSVKNAWACSTSEARPAGTPTSMPMNSSENLTTPMMSATAAIQRQGIERRGAITSTASDASAYRKEESSSGGTSSRPTLMTTKLKPQSAATRTARAMWRGAMSRHSGASESHRPGRIA